MSATQTTLVRRPAVAGAFYPGSPVALDEMVSELFRAAGGLPGVRGGAANAPLGLLTPHAGLVYSGVVAAAAWNQLAAAAADATVVVLGTNHGASWLDGVGLWEEGAWHIPNGDVPVDADLAQDILGLGEPFVADRAAHASEHSIEVQLPLLRYTLPGARIVPLTVSAGRASAAREAGERLGQLIARRRSEGESIVLAISTDMAHYPSAAASEHVTEILVPAISALDPAGLVAREDAVAVSGVPGLVCGMCGIEPTFLGLAALRAMGATAGTPLASATSADAGGAGTRTVGYLAVRFD
jgi:AmmeMemoRadiSam system protein B